MEDRPIELRDLRKTFGEQTVLNGISFEVGSGETIAVLGRSGTGKSVLLKIIIGLQPPDSGSVRISGQEITNADVSKLNAIRKKTGFLFQQAALYDSLSVEENVGFPLSRHTKMPEQERRERVRELLSNVGMEKDLDKMPAEISGGMQKRVGLARALALDPEIVLFGEPTAGLDPITAGEIAELILDLKKKRRMTAVVVTHDLRGAQAFADRMVLIQEGSVLAQGTFADIQKSKDRFVAEFVRGGFRG